MFIYYWKEIALGTCPGCMGTPPPRTGTGKRKCPYPLHPKEKKKIHCIDRIPIIIISIYGQIAEIQRRRNTVQFPIWISEKQKWYLAKKRGTGSWVGEKLCCNSKAWFIDFTALNRTKTEKSYFSMKAYKPLLVISTSQILHYINGWLL